MLSVADRESSLIITGNGDVLEPEQGIVAIGSGGAYAQSAARALLENTELAPRDIVTKSLEIAKCAYRVEPEFPEVGARLGQAIGEIISKQKSVKDALDAAQKDAVAIMKKGGRKIDE